MNASRATDISFKNGLRGRKTIAIVMIASGSVVINSIKCVIVQVPVSPSCEKIFATKTKEKKSPFKWAISCLIWLTFSQSMHCRKFRKKKNQKTEGKTLTERPRVVNINA